jgi:regulator of sirC expression with transglutaminase-like and TPR domain
LTSLAEAQEILRLVGQQPDEEIDLAGTALALGVLDRPGTDLEDYRRHLAAIAQDIRDRAAQAGDLRERIALLREVIIERHGYSGDHDTYDDLQNANMLRVIDRRRGLPVALGILFMHAARAVKWEITGLNFPGHFLLRMDHEGERFILDPFNEGQVRTVMELRDLLKATAGSAAELEPGHYQPVANRDVLLRLQNNIKLRHLSAHEVPKALQVLGAMRLFAPDEPSLWRETGLLEAHAGNLNDAIKALEIFLALADTDQHRHQAASLIQQLRNRLN